jgi:hypothetical protein
MLVTNLASDPARLDNAWLLPLGGLPKPNEHV